MEHAHGLGPEGARHRRHDPAHDRGRRRVAARPGEAARLHRRPRRRQPVRLRPGVAEVRRPRHPGHEPQRLDGLARPQPVVELRRQPPRPLRAEPPHVRPQPVPGRRHRAVPDAELRVPRGWRRLGVQPLRRPVRPLGEAQPRGSWTSTSSRPTSTPTSSVDCSSSTPRATRGSTGKIDDIIAQNLDALESDTSQAELTERDLDSDDFARGAHRRSRRHPPAVRRATSTSAAKPTTR